jgi:hypothetical protein
MSEQYREMSVKEYAKSRGKDASTVRGWVKRKKDNDGWVLTPSSKNGNIKLLSVEQVMVLDDEHGCGPVQTTDDTVDGELMPDTSVSVESKAAMLDHQYANQNLGSSIIPAEQSAAVVQSNQTTAALTERIQALSPRLQQLRENSTNARALARVARRKQIGAEAKVEALEDELYRREVYEETTNNLAQGIMPELDEVVGVESNPKPVAAPQADPPPSVANAQSGSVSDFPC